MPDTDALSEKLKQQGGDVVTSTGNWMSNVQRALALILIVCLAVIVVILIVRMIYSADVSDVVDLAKTLTAAVVNMGLIALGFFFGSSIAKQQSDASQQNIVDKLTSTAPGSIPPVPPIAPPPAPASPWWPKLTGAEKDIITAKAQGLGGGDPDPRVAAFITASQVGSANADDLAHLVALGLLTPARADEIKAS